MKIVAWIIGVPVGILLFMLALGAGISASEKGQPPTVRTEKQKFENAAVECWKSYERKSLMPAEKANLAWFCEGLEKRANESR